MTFGDKADNISPVMDKVNEQNIYELGYHLAPYLPAEELSQAVEKSLKARITALGGEITSELNPSLTRLAYMVTNVINNKHTKFSDAYFGAFRFRLAPEAIPQLEEELAKDDLIVRHLLISLPAGSEAIAAPRRQFVASSNVARSENTPFEIERILPEKETEKVALSKEELDLEIDKLVEN